MAFKRLIPGGPGGSSIQSNMVRISYAGGKNKTTTLNLYPEVTKALGFAPDEKIDLAIDIGSDADDGLIQIGRCPQGEDFSKSVAVKPTGNLILRIGADLRPKKPEETFSPISASYIVDKEKGTLTVLLPSAHFKVAPQAVALIKGEAAAEPPQLTTNRFRAPADL